MRAADRRTGRRPGRRLVLLAQAASLFACYYLVPVSGAATGGRWLRGAAAALLLTVVLWHVVRTVAREVHAEDADVQLDRLALAAVTGLVCFSLVDYLLARADAGQFAGLTTKTDALYFTVSTLTTVGFGDVHAVGQLARQIVMVQLAFNVVVLAGAARTLARGVAARRHSPGPSEGDAAHEEGR